MDAATIRANLLVARHAEVKDPQGRPWTVHIIRNGDPRDRDVRESKLYLPAIGINRLRRLIARDNRWNVELMPGALRDDRSESVITSIGADKAEALDAAVALAQRVQAGTA